jgi:hypothetical protein
MASRTDGADFLATTRLPVSTIEAIIVNPPYGLGGRLAVQFIQHSLAFMRQPDSRVRLLAFLLSIDFDSASGRTDLFADCPEFAGKIVLLRRIRWFEGPSGPSTNHGWYLYRRPDVLGAVPPTLRYAPRAVESVLDTL